MMKKAALICGLIAALVFTGCQPDRHLEDGAGGTAEPGVARAGSAGETSRPEDAGQEAEEVGWDKISMVMVGGKLYYDTGKISAVDGRCGTPDGVIASTVDGSQTPSEDDQSNFGTGFAYQYGGDDTLEIFINENWIVFEHREGTGNQVRFGDTMVDAEGLSEETLKWLDWYNALPEEEQRAISAVPFELLKASGLAETEEADKPAGGE